jgi:hypothetical protein
MCPKVLLVDSKALFIAGWSVMSATKARTLTPGCRASISALVERREASVRPRREILVGPELAKAFVILGPIPEPPPVMRTTFPAVESPGREGTVV